MQDISNNAKVEQMKLWLKGEFDIIEIAYDSYENNGTTSDVERASLSWHLTSKEKQHIHDNIYIDSNMEAIDRLRKIIKSSSNP